MDARDGRTQDMAPLAAWLVSLVVAIVAFTAMGGGQLAAPPLAHPSRWADWAADRDAVVATVAVLRLLVLAMAWYLVGATTIGALARAARWARLVRVADALSVPVVRRVLQASLGVGLTTIVVASPNGVALPATPGPTASVVAAQSTLDPPAMQPLDHPATTSVPVMRPIDVATNAAADAPLAPPGMRPLPPEQPPPVTSATEPAPPPAPDVDAATPQAQVPDTVTAEPGDHLWAIAERQVTAVHGSATTDAQVGEYWHRLVEANRGRLVDPDDPDLILPGQRFVLPSLDAPSGEA